MSPVPLSTANGILKKKIYFLLFAYHTHTHSYTCMHAHTHTHTHKQMCTHMHKKSYFVSCLSTSSQAPQRSKCTNLCFLVPVATPGNLMQQLRRSVLMLSDQFLGHSRNLQFLMLNLLWSTVVYYFSVSFVVLVLLTPISYSQTS